MQIQKYIGKGIDVVVAGAKGLQTSRPSEGEILVRIMWEGCMVIKEIIVITITQLGQRLDKCTNAEK